MWHRGQGRTSRNLAPLLPAGDAGDPSPEVTEKGVWVCIPSCPVAGMRAHGRRGTRTPDILRVKQALFRLSYSPKCHTPSVSQYIHPSRAASMDAGWVGFRTGSRVRRCAALQSADGGRLRAPCFPPGQSPDPAEPAAPRIPAARSSGRREWKPLLRDL